MNVQIDTDYLAEQLRRLLATPSPTGYTDTVVRSVCEELARLGVPYSVTRRGAILALYRGRDLEGARAIVAHLDTLGATVKYIKETGRLELVPIGTWSARAAEYCRCTIFSDEGTFRGTILPLKASGHTFNEEVDTQPVGWPNIEVRSMRTAWTVPARRRWASTLATSSQSIQAPSSWTMAISSRGTWTTKRAAR
jgi:putative aminopeptidase FrvX